MTWLISIPPSQQSMAATALAWGKNPLRWCKMSTAIDNARDWASRMVQRESRGPGDMENAMRRLEVRYGIPWRMFWALRYRPPTDLFVSVYQQLWSAYQSECERQERLIRHETAITKIKAGPFHAAVIAAETLVGEVLDHESERKLKP